MKPSRPNNRILFIRPRLLGDIIFTIPALQIFRKNFPGVQVYYLVEEQFREIGRLIPGIHQLIVVPRKMGLKRMWQFRKEIRDTGFDGVIDFHSGPKSAQLTWLSGAKLRIGYRTPNRNWAYNRLTPRNFGDSPTHSVYNQAKLLEHLGITITPDSIPPYPVIATREIPIPDEVEQAIKKEKKTVIHVGAGNSFRDWGFENFSALIAKLKDRGITIFLIGNGEDEKKRSRRLARLWDVHDFTGQLTVGQLLYLISNSDVYVGADSGPLHAASLTAVPLVALYGPNIPEISGPWRKKNVSIIQRPMACRPCSQRKCIYDIIPCMKNITMDEVYEKIIRYLL